MEEVTEDDYVEERNHRGAADIILNEFERLHRSISERAYELSRHNGSGARKPAVQVRRTDGAYEVLAASSGVSAKDLDVQVSPDDLLITGKIDHRHKAEEGDVQPCEFGSGEIFRSVHFAEKVEPNHVTTNYKDGLLRITAPIAKPQTTKVAASAA